MRLKLSSWMSHGFVPVVTAQKRFVSFLSQSAYCLTCFLAFTGVHLHKETILAVDDDVSFQNVLRCHLEQEGYHFLSALSGQELLQSLENANPAVILLDLILPEDDGLMLLPMIRSRSKAAVIVISAKNQVVDRIVGLEMGADDYLTKPFELRELSARIKAVLRRMIPEKKSDYSFAMMEDGKANRISFNGWILDRLQYQLFDSTGKSAELTSGEFKLLEAFVTNPNRVLSRDKLFELTRSGDYEAFDRAIDMQIGRIRKKINDSSRRPALLKTIRGAGYLFSGETKVT